ncbi:MAG: glycerophosphodiester phosphodiesterase family protein [bacterium]|nr:glycerophosphodiester phosphodiesterase family protein [bacterium]
MFIPLSASVWSEPARRIEVYAHRGARAFAPENTMVGYQTALHIGADWIDMDVVLTREREVLLSHDLVLNPDITRDEHGAFLAPSREALQKLPPDARGAYDRTYAAMGLTLKELQRFDVGRLNPASAYARFFPDQVPADGARMPTLREVVRFADKATQKKIRYQVEMKTDPAHADYSPPPEAFAAAVYKVLKEEALLDRVEVHAFDFRCLYELQKLDRRIRTAYLTSRDNEKGGEESFLSPDPKVAGLWTGGKLLKDYGGSMPAMVKTLGGFAWDPEDAELTKEALDEAHRLGLKVVVWSWPEKLGTAFDAQLVAKMIDWGVDGIITDDPGRLISMLAARGLPVPVRY